MPQDIYPLVNCFVSHLPEDLKQQINDLERVEQFLEEGVDAGREKWPQIQLDTESFVEYLAQHMPHDELPEKSLNKIKMSDLYLTCACVRKDPKAIETFEKRCLPSVDRALQKLKLPQATKDEVKQTLRSQLFVQFETAKKTMIANYSGRGNIENWLRIIAVRTAGKIVGSEKKEVPMKDDFIDDVLPRTPDLEMDHLKDLYKGEFASAFNRAFNAITPRERNLLRQHYIDKLSIDKLGAMYDVHRATTARWLDKARALLLKNTRKELMQHLKVSKDEYESIMRLIDSRLDVTLTSFLKPK